MKRFNIEWLEISKTKCRGIVSIETWINSSTIIRPPDEKKEFEITLEINGGQVLSYKPLRGRESFKRLTPEESRTTDLMCRSYMGGVRNDDHIFTWDISTVENV